LAELDRGVHPDLVEEEAAAQAEAAEAAPPRARSSRSRRSEPAAQDASVQPAPEAADEVQSSSPESGEADWLARVDEVKDPVEKFKLLAKNLPRDVIEHEPTIYGWVGQQADKRARDLLRQQDREAQEQAKREAAARGDLYTLGEMTQRELQEREQQQQVAQSGTFMDGVVLFQQQLPEEIQRKVAGQAFGVGKGQAAGVAEYLSFISEERIKLEKAELEREFQRRESALRKSVLAEINGDEPVPEREGGTPGRVREVTDEQIEAMTMQEYNALFDENGRPKPGVRHRATRGIPLIQR